MKADLAQLSEYGPAAASVGAFLGAELFSRCAFAPSGTRKCAEIRECCQKWAAQAGPGRPVQPALGANIGTVSPQEAARSGDPQPAASTSYDRIADRYEAVRGGDARARPLAEALARWIEPGSSVVDVGAGTGIVTAALESSGYDVCGIDLSRAMLARAAGRLPGRVVCGDAQALPFASRSVDAVTLVWVLHHVGRPELALGEASRVLRPGGRIVAISGMPLPGTDELSPIFAELDHVKPRLGRTSDVAAAATAPVCS